MRRLTVSLDSLAPLAGATSTDLLAMAQLAELGGADALRVSVNEELKPLGESELRDLRRVCTTLELRMPPVPSLLKVAFETRPERVILASEGREGTHTPSPLDFRAWGTALAPVVRTLREAGQDVVMLVGADLEAIKAAHSAEVRAIELFTGSLVDLPPAEQADELLRLADASRLAAKLRMRVTLGGALGLRSVERFLEAAPVAEGVVVGREWVGKCVLLGVDRATRDLRARIA